MGVEPWGRVLGADPIRKDPEVLQAETGELGPRSHEWTVWGEDSSALGINCLDKDLGRRRKISEVDKRCKGL